MDDFDAIHFVGRAAPIPLLLQFANYEQYFDKTSMQHYVAAASDPKKVLYYDTGHDLNDPQALEDRYDWLVKFISLRRETPPHPLIRPCRPPHLPQTRGGTGPRKVRRTTWSFRWA